MMSVMKKSIIGGLKRVRRGVKRKAPKKAETAKRQK